MKDVTAQVAQQYGKFADLYGSQLGQEVMKLLEGEYDSASVWSDNPTVLALQAGAQSVIKEMKAKIETALKLRTGTYVAVSDAAGIRIITKKEFDDAGRTDSTGSEPGF